MPATLHRGCREGVHPGKVCLQSKSIKNSHVCVLRFFQDKMRWVHKIGTLKRKQCFRFSPLFSSVRHQDVWSSQRGKIKAALAPHSDTSSRKVRLFISPQWVRCVIPWIRRGEGAIIIEDTASEMHIVH